MGKLLSGVEGIAASLRYSSIFVSIKDSKEDVEDSFIKYVTA